jgi:hypothetical protein
MALHKALKDQLGAAMVASDWRSDPEADTGFEDGVVGSFRYRVSDDFTATTWFAWLGEYPPLQVDTVIGLTYEPLYRLWPALLGRSYSELRVGLDEVTAEPAYPVELWEPNQVPLAVDQLVGPVLEHVVAWATPLASLDARLGSLQEIPDSPDESVALAGIPVVLAASGRIDEARQALASALAQHPSDATTRYWQSFVEKFTEWIESGAVLHESTA